MIFIFNFFLLQLLIFNKKKEYKKRIPNINKINLSNELATYLNIFSGVIIKKKLNFFKNNKKYRYLQNS